MISKEDDKEIEDMELKPDDEKVSVEGQVMCNARKALVVLLEEFYDSATLTRQGTHVYGGHTGIIEDMDYDISKFIKENCA